MKVKLVHLEAILVWVVYTIINKMAFFIGLSQSKSLVEALLINIIPSIAFGIIFLYIFLHEDFFKFARDIERQNTKKTVKIQHYFLHYGKVVTCLVLGVLSGALLAALSIRLLLPKFKYRYYLVMLSSMLSPIFTLGIVRSLIPSGLPF